MDALGIPMPGQDSGPTLEVPCSIQQEAWPQWSAVAVENGTESCRCLWCQRRQRWDRDSSSSRIEVERAPRLDRAGGEGDEEMGNENESVSAVLILMWMVGCFQCEVRAKSRFAGRLRVDRNVGVGGERGRVCILERVRDGLE